jgi:hypothetical protein
LKNPGAGMQSRRSDCTLFPEFDHDKSSDFGFVHRLLTIQASSEH